ncbi:MAG: hypothetical protein N2203_06690 [Bacteroidia bacterium]|nr:hypothetical protein [Bacteroidia bacterium]
MKKLLMIVTISGFIAGTNAMAINTKCGDDKDKKCSKECCKKGAKEGKECCKKNGDKKECSSANGEKKSCCKKGEKHEENKTTQPTK